MDVQPESAPTGIRERILELRAQRGPLDREILRAINELQADCDHALTAKTDDSFGLDEHRICINCAFEEPEDPEYGFMVLLAPPIAAIAPTTFLKLRELQPSLADAIALISAGPAILDLPAVSCPPWLTELGDLADQQMAKYPWMFNSPEVARPTDRTWEAFELAKAIWPDEDTTEDLS